MGHERGSPAIWLKHNLCIRGVEAAAPSLQLLSLLVGPVSPELPR